jgi:mono/diheme cytochrome c family protein
MSSGVESRSKPASGDSSRGEELYHASCIVCHGPRASGAIGPKLVNNPVLSNDQAFWKVVYEGRHVMPPLKGAVTEQQMADIRAWLQTLR